jgi:hypothetical protein
MLRKKESYTKITPIPGFIPRQLAIDLLHSHSEIITLNPLVLDHYPIAAPRTASADEFYSTWYEIVQRIQYLPGVGKVGSGQIKFSGCFHDMPWGLQTHVYAAFNIELRHRYRIDGNQPGFEPPLQLELGLLELGAPKDGLYIREDIDIKCNIAMVGFVKTQQQAASKEMVQRIIKKAELLDAGVLQAMFENGKLRTANPNDHSKIPSIPRSPSSPGHDIALMQGQYSPGSPPLGGPGGGGSGSSNGGGGVQNGLARADSIYYPHQQQQPRAYSMISPAYPYGPPSSGQQPPLSPGGTNISYPPQWSPSPSYAGTYARTPTPSQQQQQQQSQQYQQYHFAHQQSQQQQNQNPSKMSAVQPGAMEMMGDTHFVQGTQETQGTSPGLHPPGQGGAQSPPYMNYQHMPGASPGPAPQQGFSVELPAAHTAAPGNGAAKEGQEAWAGK